MVKGTGMNLVTDRWIPVLDDEGRFRLVSLSTVFSEGDRLADLSVNPCQRISLMRLLVCIVQAALDGPADEVGWRECRNTFAQAALAYLDKWKDRFELFGDHAFLQVRGLTGEDNAICDKLEFSLATGSNPKLYDHAAVPEGRIPVEMEAALRLLVYQIFSPGGLIGSTKWEGVETGRTSEHAPCLDRSMLVTLIKGKTLTETVYDNLLTKETIKKLPNCSWGRPSWETAMTREALSSGASTYLGRLVPCPRAIRYTAGKATSLLANAISYPKLPLFREPWATVVLRGKGDKEEAGYVGVALEKQPWREVNAILSLNRADGQGGAFQLEHLRDLDRDACFDLWTGGLAADKSKILDTGEWSFNFSRAMLDEVPLSRYASGVEWANEGNGFLRMIVKSYGEYLKVDPKASFWNDAAQKRFWSFMDGQEKQLEKYAASGEEADKSAWLGRIRGAMLKAYEASCPHETPRQIQAYARQLGALRNWKPKSNG